MEQLLDALNRVLANTHAMFVKAQGFHWNVVGNDFYEYHEFFGNLYGELYGAVDTIAEHIRACSGYAPASYSAFSNLTSIPDQNGVPQALQMIQELYQDNLTVQESIKVAYQAAESAGEIGLSNFLQDRYDVHAKHGWMLRSTIRTNP